MGASSRISVTSITGIQALTTLTHYFKKTLNTMQSIILKGHPHFLFTPASLNTFGSQNKLGSISPQDLYLGRSPSWNEFPILFGPTWTSSSSVNIISPGEFPAPVDKGSKSCHTLPCSLYLFQSTYYSCLVSVFSHMLSPPHHELREGRIHLCLGHHYIPNTFYGAGQSGHSAVE